MRHIISILVENEAGALSRISNMFSARGYNIESLTVAPTEDASMSRLTVVTKVMRDKVGSSVGATVSDSILYPRAENSPATRDSAPASFSSRIEMTWRTTLCSASFVRS